MAPQTRSRQAAKDGASPKTADGDIVETYGDLLNELRLLTTVSVFLFGFLLNVARSDLNDSEEWLLLIAILSSASATVQFALPTIYHQAQFPYTDWEKFQLRVHAFVTTGLPLLGIAFYFSLALAAWGQFEEMALVIAFVPVIVAGLTYAGRRVLTDAES